MNNVIAYVAPKDKTMVHSTSLNNSISCVVGISILGFKTYCKRVFALMEIKTTSTFKQFFQEETLSTKNNKSYYQRYYVKRLRSFHKQAMFKQKIYDNMLARRSGTEYIKGRTFQTSFINMEEAQELTMNIQPKRKQHKRCRCVSVKHLRISSKDCPVGHAIRKAKISASEMALYKYEAKKTAEDAAAEEERKCLEADAA